jgi:membrane protein YdbS with pleckstrin-like domain
MQKPSTEFRPSARLKKLYFTYLFSAAVPMGAVLVAASSLAAEASAAMTLLLAALVAASAFVSYWIPRYCASMRYGLTGSEITWRRGVWFRTTGIVPYNRITNIDIVQGPVSRAFGIASLKIQTAGYSARGGAEIRMDGIERFEELREAIMSHVRGSKPVAVETYAADASARTFEELTRIRRLLETRGKKR